MRQTKLFISYSHVDRDFVIRLTSLLTDMSYSVWLDEKLRGGQVWWSEILKQISGCDIFLYLLSPESITSNYCQSELKEALRLRKQVLPIRIRDKTSIPQSLSHIQYLDMFTSIEADIIARLQGTLAALAESIPANSPEPLYAEITSLPEVPEDITILQSEESKSSPSIKFRYAPGTNPFLPPDSEDVASHLKRVSSIQVKQSLRRNQSNSQILLVDVEPAINEPPPFLSGPHYLKIHADDTELDIVEKVERLAKTPIGRAMPAIVDHVVHNGRLAVLYKPALGTIRPQAIASLAQLLEKETSLALKHLEGLAELLCEWNRTPLIESYHPRDLLLELLGPRRTSGDESVQKRVWRSMKISDQDVRLLIGGELLVPNPLTFLSKGELWQNDTSQSIAVPLGHTHGDLHADNLICQRFSRTKPLDAALLPDVLDFATYRSNALVFFDFTYLEFDILTRVCPPDKLENRLQITPLLEYLTRERNFDLSQAPPGGPLIRSTTELIRPLRKAACSFFGERSDDFEIAFWVAAVAVGLNFARKRTRSVNHYLNLLGLMYASVALKRILDDLRISYKSEIVPSIPWYERTWDNGEVK